ncbi:MAG: DUF1289 domain-containing protein [Betaproteobacteria bacterium]|nr:DUF1289 domain-containing protein [Betaproteobacteria bacterium]
MSATATDPACDPASPAATTAALRRPDLAAALRAARAGRGLPSPCVGVCRMDAASGLCLGCWRTLDEIAHWSAYSPEQQRACWQRIGRRQQQAGTGTSLAPPRLG